MPQDNTLARSLHDLGLATWFGGSLMGAVGLNGAAASVDQPDQRLQVASAGWARWTPVNLAGIGAHLVGGTLLLAANKGRLAGQRGVATATIAKAALTGVALGATGYARALGAKLQQAGEVAVEGGTTPSAGTPSEVANAQRQLTVLQWATPALTGGMLVLNAIMGEQQRPTNVATGMLQGARDRTTGVLQGARSRLPWVAAVTLAGTALLGARARRQRKDQTSQAVAVDSAAPTAGALPPDASTVRPLSRRGWRRRRQTASPAQVRQAMTANPVAIPVSMGVVDAAKQMIAQEKGPLPVVEGDRVVAMVTDRDIIARVVAAGRDPSTLRVEEIATKDLVTVRPDQDLEEARRLLAQHQLDRLLVVEDGDRLVGILSEADIRQDEGPLAGAGPARRARRRR